MSLLSFVANQDHVKLRFRGGGEVHIEKARVLGELFLNIGKLVRSVVVADQMQRLMPCLVLGRFQVEVAQKHESSTRFLAGSNAGTTTSRKAGSRNR